MPGSTLFIPICDVTFSLIGLIAQFVDPKLERFAPANERGINIVDDRFGLRPAGTEAWIKSGFLGQDSSLPLTHLERQACYFTFSEPAAICQNMFLATEAIGLGGWTDQAHTAGTANPCRHRDRECLVGERTRIVLQNGARKFAIHRPETARRQSSVGLHQPHQMHRIDRGRRETETAALR